MPSLLVTNDFPPKVGGIQTYLYELWRRLPPEEVAVLTTPYAGDAAFDAAQPFRIDRVREPVMLPTAALAARIDALARDVGAEVILLDPALPLGGVGRRLEAAPVVVIVHGAEITVPAHVPGVGGRLRRVLRDAAGVLAAGWYPALAAQRAAASPLRALVVPPGVDVQRFQPARDAREVQELRARFGLPSDRPIALGVSRLVPRKGFDVLIDAVAMTPSELHLVLVGDGRDRARLERRAEVLGVHSRVTFLGRVTDEDLPLVYRACDVFAMLCRDRWFGLEVEGFGIVFLEAAASGLPSLAGRSGGSHEAVEHGVGGFIVDPLDVASVHHHLDLLVRDDERRRAMGAAARQFAERCSYEQRVRLLEPLARGDLAALHPLIPGHRR